MSQSVPGRHIWRTPKLACSAAGVSRAGLETARTSELRFWTPSPFYGFFGWWWKCSVSVHWPHIPGRRRSCLEKEFGVVQSWRNSWRWALWVQFTNWETPQVHSDWKSLLSLITRKCTQVPNCLLRSLAASASLDGRGSRSVTSQLLLHAVVNCSDVGWDGTGVWETC